MPEKPDPEAQPSDVATGGRSDRRPELIAELRTALAEATHLLETASDTSSDAWFDLSERLHDACWKLAAATPCHSLPPQPSRPVAKVDVPTQGPRGRCHNCRWSRR